MTERRGQSYTTTSGNWRCVYTSLPIAHICSTFCQKRGACAQPRFCFRSCHQLRMPTELDFVNVRSSLVLRKESKEESRSRG